MVPSSRTSLRTVMRNNPVGSKKRFFLGIVILAIVICIIVVMEKKDNTPTNISPTQMNASLLGANPNPNDGLVTNNPIPPSIVPPNNTPAQPIQPTQPIQLPPNNIPGYAALPPTPAPLPIPTYNASLIPANAPQAEATPPRQPVSAHTRIPEMPRPVGRVSNNTKNTNAAIRGQDPSQNFHVVESGDTLGKICKRYYKTIQYVEELAAYNNLTINTCLKIKQRIELPTLQILSQGQQKASTKPASQNTIKFRAGDNGKAQIASSQTSSSNTCELYCVQPNENLTKISKKKGISFLLLYEYNKDILPDGDPDQLETGMQLRIPLAKSK